MPLIDGMQITDAHGSFTLYNHTNKKEEVFAE